MTSEKTQNIPEKDREKEKNNAADPRYFSSGTSVGIRKRVIGSLKKILVFFAAFVAASAVIQIDAEASQIIGNKGFFTSSFIRKNIRQVDIKIMGFEICLENGIALVREEDS